MAEPLNQTKGKEKVFSFEYSFKFEIKEEYDKDNGWIAYKTVYINGKKVDDYYLDRTEFPAIIKALRRKLAVLESITDDSAYDTIAFDILIDIARLLYRLHYRLNY
jgi:heterodisulfide reductase subunit A-like polyferredoxin